MDEEEEWLGRRKLPLWTSTLGGTAFFSLHVPFDLVGVDVTGCWSCFRLAAWSGKRGDVALVGVGVIGLPSLISSTIWSASLDRSPSGLKGLSHPSELKHDRENTLEHNDRNETLGVVFERSWVTGRGTGFRGRRRVPSDRPLEFHRRHTPAVAGQYVKRCMAGRELGSRTIAGSPNRDDGRP